MLTSVVAGYYAPHHSQMLPSRCLVHPRALLYNAAKHSVQLVMTISWTSYSVEWSGVGDRALVGVCVWQCGVPPADLFGEEVDGRSSSILSA